MANEKVNPANAPEKSLPSRERIPMALPQTKLAVPEIPGYHLHWMRGDAQRIAQALKAGYEFVEEGEVEVVNSGLADDARKNGNSDMGTRISALAGADAGQDGQPQRLYLMKLREEWWQADQQALEDRNEQIAKAIRGGRDVGQNPDGGELRYIPEGHQKGMADIFTRKTRRT